MADKKEVSSIRYSIDGKKGKYTGTVNTGLLNNQPDGYGKIVFMNGDVIEGRFKNGAFIKGKAISSKGTVLEGEFDYLHFLSGKILPRVSSVQYIARESVYGPKYLPFCMFLFAFLTTVILGYSSSVIKK